LVFSSLEFIFIFLPVFLAVYFLLRDRYKNSWLLLGSLAFYAYGTISQPLALILLIASVAVNYAAGFGIEAYGRYRKLIFILALIYNIGCLFAFKYLNFLLETATGLLNLFPALNGINLPGVGLILPLGISFYTFSIVSYIADVYTGKIHAEKSPIKLGVYLCMFPRLIAGPIVAYSGVSEQIDGRRHSLSSVNSGLMDFTAGLGLKVLLANQIGRLWSDIGSIGFDSISTPLAWMGVVAFSMQIYFDFWGYSLMAVGLGRMLGFELPENFNSPYTALTMTDFWRRWHMTLGLWFRNYIYIPLGGSRSGKAKAFRNMLVVWLLTGLWHGASWNFVLWGLITFLIIAVEKFLIGDFLNKKPVFGHIYMAAVIPLMWAVFAITDFSSLRIYFGRLFPFSGPGINVYSLDYIKYGKMYGIVLLIGLFFCTQLPRKIYNRIKGSVFSAVVLIIVFWACVYCLYKGLDDPFLYFKF
jgi:alginate O-acetyltransferase complex protein AlgI